LALGEASRCLKKSLPDTTGCLGSIIEAKSVNFTTNW
jgi:hypothetical protein